MNVTNGTTITATTPARATGGAVNVGVTTTGGTGTLTNGYTYVLASAPTVASINPIFGLSNGGTGATITGTNFAPGATVTFGGTSATAVTVVSATSITVTTPSHAIGVVNIVVTNPDTQSGTLTNGFTYFASPPPTLLTINPTSGTTLGGTSITLTGTNFANGATVMIGGSAATGVTFVNSTSITATPPHTRRASPRSFSVIRTRKVPR